MEIELCGYKVQIDEEDYERVLALKWHIDTRIYKKCGYVYFRHIYPEVSGKRLSVALHRFILGIDYCDGYLCDHINGDTLDNRKTNLRKCTYSGNNKNSRKRKDNTTGYKGVSLIGSGKAYRARIRVDGKSLYLGQYPTAEEAHAAYCEASKKYHGEFGRTE